jgi:predicted nucleotidyltransferase
MKNTSLDLSDKIDAVFLELFEKVAAVAGTVQVPFFVIGAMARDIIFEYGYDIRTIRATNDIDLGVQVSDWDEYAKLKDELLATELFTKAREFRRISYKGSLHVDMVPFGGISRPHGSISWPPEHESVMKVLGFEESYRHALTIRLRSSPLLEISFASLPGLAAMKLFAWNDNPSLRRRDAEDLSFILQKYLEAGNEDRLFAEESDLVQQEDFDYILAGARLLGRDVASILEKETQKVATAILERETDDGRRLRLVEDMALVDATLVSSGDHFETKLALLQQFRSGMLDRIQPM